VAITSLEPDDGFATPAAAAVSLALAMVAAAMTTAAVSELRFAHADLARTQANYALDAAQTRAALGLIATASRGRLRWMLPDGGEVLAEPEVDKLDLADAARLDDATLARLGVADPDRLRGRLADLGGADAADIGMADAAPLWRACARSIVSPIGTATKIVYAAAAAPSSPGVDWRIGQVWRIRTALASGWVDDPLVRFTGDPLDPAAIVERKMALGGQEGGRCDGIFAAG
jgi:hypothetical protein